MDVCCCVLQKSPNQAIKLLRTCLGSFVLHADRKAANKSLSCHCSVESGRLLHDISQPTLLWSNSAQCDPIPLSVKNTGTLAKISLKNPSPTITTLSPKVRINFADFSDSNKPLPNAFGVVFDGLNRGQWVKLLTQLRRGYCICQLVTAERKSIRYSSI
jgi:hypothetical protein